MTLVRFVLTLLISTHAFADTQLPVNLKSGTSTVLPGPQGYSYKVSCDLNSHQPESIIYCRIRWNGGPAQGVQGQGSYDKCSAVQSAIEACRREINNHELARQFCVKHSLHYGGGATCSDSTGQSVDVSNCPQI